MIQLGLFGAFSAVITVIPWNVYDANSEQYMYKYLGWQHDCPKNVSADVSQKHCH